MHLLYVIFIWIRSYKSHSVDKPSNKGYTDRVNISYFQLYLHFKINLLVAQYNACNLNQ